MNTYDLTNPTHFCFCLEAARDNFKHGYHDDMYVEIFPLKEYDSYFDGVYKLADYTSKYSGSVNFTWAPKSLLDKDGKLNEEGYECAFKFTVDPDILEKELRTLGLISVDEEYSD